jgi:hypothetical protein
MLSDLFGRDDSGGQDVHPTHGVVVLRGLRGDPKIVNGTTRARRDMKDGKIAVAEPFVGRMNFAPPEEPLQWFHRGRRYVLGAGWGGSVSGSRTEVLATLRAQGSGEAKAA